MIDMDAVTGILRDAAREVILPRARSLSEGEVMEKGPGELVTVVDQEAERVITARLRGLVDAPVVGEEAVAADPSLVEALRTEPVVWLVDPLDGTRNFVEGRREYGVMAALVHGGETVAAWIVQPEWDRAYAAERGAGAWRDGTRLRRDPAPTDPGRLRGSVLTRFLAPEARRHVEASVPRFAGVDGGAHCSAVDYPLLCEGSRDFLLFHRTLPWDHAPGALLLAEAGGVSRRPDGTPYRPDQGPDVLGLLNAADETCWKTVRELLLP
ncbi:inositol monophosphatase family protein [Nocardiopsis changdeensis]|uniref:Inositol monophosphatase n=1 Tax=Nocardiopsis changdeensis TaxID=2831969 RepID=A0ABX8BU69_9ACTN|nr:MULTISPECIES: inositol monophosphatase family protein [Nocardiopsis]QUX24637.1 inositol monophosphatase [Nocardiopsis changdeensis]QYX35026.1 inositol monophosphatase [Nocardiopsis sp. MT53]